MEHGTLVRVRRDRRAKIEVMPQVPPRRPRPPRNRVRRFLNVGLTLFRVYFGYKRIGFLARWRGEGWAESRRQRHHHWSAQALHDTAIRNQGLLIKTAQFL